MTARLAVLAMIVTSAAAVTWAATGRHVFTKYESIEERSDPPRSDDPFAAAGFYDGAPARVVHVKAFHFGLLPSAGSVVDKHVVSLATVAAPLWFLTFASAWRRRSSRRRARRSAGFRRPFTCDHCK